MKFILTYLAQVSGRQTLINKPARRQHRVAPSISVVLSPEDAMRVMSDTLPTSRGAATSVSFSACMIGTKYILVNILLVFNVSYFCDIDTATSARGPAPQEQVLASSPILEAFGNAKTVNNHNSSRFVRTLHAFVYIFMYD